MSDELVRMRERREELIWRPLSTSKYFTGRKLTSYSLVAASVAMLLVIGALFTIMGQMMI